VVFAEADINWVPGCLQHAEMQYAAWRTLLDPRPRRTPSEYWHENMYATFQHDAVGLRMLDEIGDDRVMWGSDYPHLESTLGFGWRAINDVIDSVAESSARKILGDNARAVFEIA
jgi:predicted TIM-barrel fold metal-dependent hydrolase